jgi:CubicO group peptidase (beta-lactamase class C family)
MSWLTKSFLLLLTVCGVHAARADEIDDLLCEQMRRHQMPGAAVAVIRNGAIEKLAAYGLASVEQGTAVTPESAFQIASATKAFTGILLGHLVEQGRLDLAAPVSRYLPDAPAAWGGMTVRHLANHTAGFAMGAPGSSTLSLEQAYTAIRDRPLATKPGEREQYAIDDFVVLALVMEKAGGKPYAALLDDVIVRPLGLRHTRFENAVGDRQGGLNKADVVPGRVSTYSLEGGRQTLYWFLYPPATYAAGGLFSSITDMAAVLLALDRGTLLGPRGRAAMWEAGMLADGRRGSFAAGWIATRVRGHAAVGHSGGPALADVLYVPSQRVGVIVLTNQRTLYPNLARTIAARYVPSISS